MKKAAILTINDYNNYGNRLQNYAVQETLKKQGFQVKTIVHDLDYKFLSAQYKIGTPSIVNRLKNFLQTEGKLNKVKNKLLKKSSPNPILEERITNFKKFTNEYIAETNFSISENSIPKNLGEQFDYFFTGSDQVWNPNFRMGSAIDFLTFVPKEKRISLSASIGVSTIPEKFHESYKKYLSELQEISVREHQGVKLVNQLSGREAEVLIDPTLYLSKDEWLKISKPHGNKPKEKYLLTYFLGEIPNEYQRFIEDYAKKERLIIVNLADVNAVKYYTADPSNFIDYIHSAQAFFTDSYHGIIFSILMETPFLIFERMDSTTPKMNSRMETLKKTLKLPNEVFFNVNNRTPICYQSESLIDNLIVEKRKMQSFLMLSIER